VSRIAAIQFEPGVVLYEDTDFKGEAVTPEEVRLPGGLKLGSLNMEQFEKDFNQLAKAISSADAKLVTASPRLLKALSRDPEVAMLSAATARNPRSLW